MLNNNHLKLAAGGHLRPHFLQIHIANEQNRIATAPASNGNGGVNVGVGVNTMQSQCTSDVYNISDTNSSAHDKSVLKNEALNLAIPNLNFQDLS